MALQDKLKDSTLSLEGNGLSRKLQDASWGFNNPNVTAPNLNPLDPALSALQYTYSVDSNPANVKIVSFNKTPYKPFLPKQSKLDELDTNAPFNKEAGLKGSVVSQIYKSATGKKYKDLGPSDGRY
jgi:hypothetical protein